MSRGAIGPRDTVLITGGSSGIGAGLASALHARGATVVISGRDLDRLHAVADQHPGMEVLEMDAADAASIQKAAVDLESQHPALTVLINNAGVQRLLDFATDIPPGPAEIGEEIATNLTGLINVTSAFLPALRRAERARVVHVTSGLALVPLTAAPVYSATKAAVRSFTLSLRRQLRGTSVQVVELLPPVVKTGLHRDQDRQPPRAMQLDAFTAAALKGLDSGRDEIFVGLAKVLRVGSRIAPGRFLAIVNKGT